MQVTINIKYLEWYVILVKICYYYYSVHRHTQTHTYTQMCSFTKIVIDCVCFLPFKNVPFMEFPLWLRV